MKHSKLLISAICIDWRIWGTASRSARLVYIARVVTLQYGFVLSQALGLLCGNVSHLPEDAVRTVNLKERFRNRICQQFVVYAGAAA